MAGGVPESDGLFSVADDCGQMACGRSSGKSGGLAILSNSDRGAAGVRARGVAVEIEPWLESGLAGRDGAGNVVSVRHFVRHRGERDYCGDIASAIVPRTKTKAPRMEPKHPLPPIPFLAEGRMEQQKAAGGAILFSRPRGPDGTKRNRG